MGFCTKPGSLELKALSLEEELYIYFFIIPSHSERGAWIPLFVELILLGPFLYSSKTCSLLISVSDTIFLASEFSQIFKTAFCPKVYSAFSPTKNICMEKSQKVNSRTFINAPATIIYGKKLPQLRITTTSNTCLILL